MLRNSPVEGRKQQTSLLKKTSWGMEGLFIVSTVAESTFIFVVDESLPPCVVGLTTFHPTVIVDIPCLVTL